MHPDVQKYWEQYERVHNEIFKWSEGLSDDQLNWHPTGDATNTIGNLMSHILGGELFSIVERVGGVPVTRDRSSEFSNRVSRDSLVQRRAEVEGQVRGTLEKLTPADFGRVLKIPGGDTTVEKWMIYLISHISGHMGQIILTRKLINARNR